MIDENKLKEQTAQLSVQENVDDTSASFDDDFDLSDITHQTQELSREEIIAAAEAAAFSEHQN